jgi:hypothetical protein
VVLLCIHGNLNGQGKITFSTTRNEYITVVPKENELDGTFKNNMLNGQGSMIYSSGEKYIVSLKILN